MFVPVNSRYVAILGFSFQFQHCAYDLVTFRHKTTLLVLGKDHVWLKMLVFVTTNTSHNSLLKMIQQCDAYTCLNAVSNYDHWLGSFLAKLQLTTNKVNQVNFI